MSIIMREAQVVDNADPDKQGLVKVRILPEMQNFTEDVLPWAGQYKDGESTSATNGTHIVYEKNSYVRVIVEDYPFFKKIRIISNDYLQGIYVYQNLNLASISELGTQTYPQPTFTLFKDGTVFFHNTDTGETGTLYKNGGYHLVDASGNVFLNAGDQEIKVYNSKGSLDLDANGKLTTNFSSDLAITVSGNSTISTTGTTEIDSTGNLTVKSTANVTVQGVAVQITGGTLQVNGTATPTGTGGFCALPACLWNGAVHTGNIISNT